MISVTKIQFCMKRSLMLKELHDWIDSEVRLPADGIVLDQRTVRPNDVTRRSRERTGLLRNSPSENFRQTTLNQLLLYVRWYPDASACKFQKSRHEVDSLAFTGMHLDLPSLSSPHPRSANQHTSAHNDTFLPWAR